MRMKIKLFCIMLAVSSSWAYAKPKFEDIRVFETSSRGQFLLLMEMKRQSCRPLQECSTLSVYSKAYLEVSFLLGERV